MQSRPTFDDWIEYCFTQGYADFHNNNESELEAVWARQGRFAMDPVSLTHYMIRLFEAPSFIADRYTDDQIADAVWFIFGVGSGYCGSDSATSTEVPPDLQVRWMRSVATMYTGLFDRVCGERGRNPDAPLSNTSKVDIAVYMIWDMDVIECAAMSRGRAPDLAQPVFEVLRTVLLTCRTSTCLQSALHGLGHLSSYHGSTVVRIIDDFLNARAASLPAWLVGYANSAREGQVQ